MQNGAYASALRDGIRAVRSTPEEASDLISGRLQLASTMQSDLGRAVFGVLSQLSPGDREKLTNGQSVRVDSSGAEPAMGEDLRGLSAAFMRTTSPPDHLEFARDALNPLSLRIVARWAGRSTRLGLPLVNLDDVYRGQRSNGGLLRFQYR